MTVNHLHCTIHVQYDSVNMLCLQFLISSDTMTSSSSFEDPELKKINTRMIETIKEKCVIINAHLHYYKIEDKPVGDTPHEHSFICRSSSYNEPITLISIAQLIPIFFLLYKTKRGRTCR